MRRFEVEHGCLFDLFDVFPLPHQTSLSPLLCHRILLEHCFVHHSPLFLSLFHPTEIIMGDTALEEAKRRTLGWAVHNSYHDEKQGWRGDGLLPSPAMASRQSILGTLMSFVGDRLAPSTSNSTRHHVPLSSRTEAPTLLQPSWSTVRFVLLCSLWYTSSAMSSNTGKVIMNAYRYPVTLTIIQFFFVASYSAICCQPVFGLTTLRKPTRAIVRSTLPMAVFQVGGHVFSSVAISRIPVSTVHTIKVRQTAPFVYLVS